MNRAWKISLAGHGVVMGVLILGLPHWGRKPLEISDPIPIEIVTTVGLPSSFAPALDKKKEEVPLPPVRKPPPPSPAQEEIVIQPSAPPLENKTTPAPQDNGMKAPTKADPKIAEQKARADIASLLKDLKKLKSPDSPPPQPRTSDKPVTAEPTQAIPNASDKLSGPEYEALRGQLVSCWNFPIGARNAQDLVVEVTVEVKPDRTVQSATIVDSSRTLTDPFYRTAAESARRAVLKCQPLQLPPEKYDLWHKMTIQFNPKDLL